MDLAEQIKTRARELWPVEVGICSALALPLNKASLDRMLPGCRSVVCIMFPHAETALASADLYVKQYDTIFCYNGVARISHQLARYLEMQGYQAVAVPAFIPLDMSDATMGMVGAVNWKQAAVESGLASWGKNGLAVSPLFGPRTRLGGLITTAELKLDEKLDFSPCINCNLCVESCPAGALLGDGWVDKKLCADHVLSYGLRALTRLLMDVATTKDEASAKKAIYSYRTRELWQALETGNYYYCWTCQSVCPVGKGHPPADADSQG
ncbi:MAG TPA: epoxyqueuosine reductase [Dehalococcoidia bacterium]|nr:epoxyqueuosine reductase [Dehalococcoidia bacterium]